LRYIVRIWSLSALILFGSACAPVLAEVTTVRGTRVKMERPEGFKPATNFFGFKNESLSASVMVTELPIPIDAATNAYNPAGLESKGMKLISKDPVKSGDYSGYVIEARQSAFGTDFVKWINVFGDKSMTILVCAIFPVSKSEELSKSLKDSVLSARFDAEAKPLEPMSDLPFTVSGTTSLKIAGRIQNTLLLTPSGDMTAPADDAKDKSIFVVGQSLSDLDVGDKIQFARTRLHRTDNLTDIKIIEEKDVTVAGMPAREILATAIGKRGEAVFILQTVAFGRGSYFIMQGMSDMAVRTRMEYEFRSIVNSLRLKAETT
jgi:hypothetical protein